MYFEIVENEKEARLLFEEYRRKYPEYFDSSSQLYYIYKVERVLGLSPFSSIEPEKPMLFCVKNQPGIIDEVLERFNLGLKELL